MLPGVKIQELLPLFLLHLFLHGPLVDGLAVGSGLDVGSPCDFYPALLIFLLLLSLFSLPFCFLEEIIKAVKISKKGQRDGKNCTQGSHLLFPLVILLDERVDYFLEIFWLDERLCVVVNPFWNTTMNGIYVKMTSKCSLMFTEFQM